MSGHSSVRSHLDRFGIIEDPMCVCDSDDYETVEYLIWYCERFGSERHRLIHPLSELDVLHGTPGLHKWIRYDDSNFLWTSSIKPFRVRAKWSAIKCCIDFLESFEIAI
jgi:hypothetical protein